MTSKKKTPISNEKKLAALKDEVFTIVLTYWEDEDADCFDDLHKPLDDLREDRKTTLAFALKSLPKKTVQVELTDAQITTLTNKFENDNLCLSDNLVSTLKNALKSAK